jgi:hypothetical protein
MARLKSSARKTIMVSGHGPISRQVKPRKKVRFAEDPIPEQDKPSKKANPTQAALHQTIEGRVCKSYGIAKTSAKDERARREKAHRGLDKLLDEYLASDDDTNVDASEEITGDEPQGEPEGMAEGPDEGPRRRWQYHGPGRWTPIQEGEEEVAADANTYSSTTRPYLVIVRHDGEESKFEINGTALEEMSSFFRAARSGRWISPDAATVIEDDPDHFASYLLATFHWRKFRRDVHDAICASKPHPTEGDVPDEVRQGREQAFETLIGTYIVADKYGDLHRANSVLDQIVRFSRATKLLPHLPAINQVYDSTVKGNPLRVLFRDFFVHEALPSALEEVVHHDDIHPDFPADIAMECCKLKFDNFNGHIKKWFHQEVAHRPKGHYHQELRELTPQARGVVLTGSYQEILQVIDTTHMPDKGPQDEDDGEPDSPDQEGISQAGRALLQAVGE